MVEGERCPQRAARFQLGLNQRPVFDTQLPVFASHAITPCLIGVLHLVFEANVLSRFLAIAP